MDPLENLKKKILSLGSEDYSDQKEEIEREKEASILDKTIASREINPQVIYEWTSPLRPYRRFSFKLLRFYIALALVFSLLFYILNAYTLIVPIWTLLFLFFVLMVTPPPQVKNRITLFGVETADLSVRWEFLSHFYVDEYLGFYLVNLVAFPPYNFRISLVVPDEKTKNEVIKHLSTFIFYKQERRRSLIERITHFLSKLLPETEEVTSKKAVSS